MELDHEFTVPVPADKAWEVLLDVERIGPCMPGATVDSFDGETITGRLKVRLGAMTITYRGTAQIVVKDERARTVTIEGTGKEARGSGTAAATVRAALHEDGERSRVTVHTKLNVTGRPAQFGRNLLSDVGAKLVKRFAANLADELARDDEIPAAPEPRAATAAEPAAEATAPATPSAPTPARPPAAPTPAPAPAPAASASGDRAEALRAAERSAADDIPRPGQTARPRRDDEAVDLLGVAGPAIARRAVPAIAGVVVVALAVRWLLRRRRR